MEYVLKNKKEDDTTCQLADGFTLYVVRMYTLHLTSYSALCRQLKLDFFTQYIISQLTLTWNTILHKSTYSTRSNL